MIKNCFRSEKSYVYCHHLEYVEESISLSPSFISSPLALLSGLLPRRSEGKLGGSPFSVAPARRGTAAAPLVVAYLASRQVFLISAASAVRPPNRRSRVRSSPRPLSATAERIGQDDGDGRRATGGGERGAAPPGT